MTDHEHEINDDAGLGDGGAVILPETVRAKAHIPDGRPQIGHVGAMLVGTATITASAEVIPGVETTSLNFPVTRTLTLKLGVDGNLHSYDLIEDGEVIWRGLGTNPQDGLLKIAIRIHEGEDPDFPKE